MRFYVWEGTGVYKDGDWLPPNLCHPDLSPEPWVHQPLLPVDRPQTFQRRPGPTLTHQPALFWDAPPGEYHYPSTSPLTSNQLPKHGFPTLLIWLQSAHWSLISTTIWSEPAALKLFLLSFPSFKKVTLYRRWPGLNSWEWTQTVHGISNCWWSLGGYMI